MKRYHIILFVMILCLPFMLPAQQGTSNEEAIHNELRELRDNLLTAIYKSDIDKMLEYMHEEVVYTNYNSIVRRGKKELGDYFNHMLQGPDAVIKSIKMNMEVDTLTILYGGDTGVVYGSAVEQYFLMDGNDFTVNTRWTATLVKENDKWLISAIHSSVDMFDNPVLDKTKNMVYWAGGIAGVVGIVLGIFLGN